MSSHERAAAVRRKSWSLQPAMPPTDSSQPRCSGSAADTCSSRARCTRSKRRRCGCSACSWSAARRRRCARSCRAKSLSLAVDRDQQRRRRPVSPESTPAASRVPTALATNEATPAESSPLESARASRELSLKRSAVRAGAEQNPARGARYYQPRPSLSRAVSPPARGTAQRTARGIAVAWTCLDPKEYAPGVSA
jgi:hypothetical protein